MDSKVSGFLLFLFGLFVCLFFFYLGAASATERRQKTRPVKTTMSGTADLAMDMSVWFVFLIDHRLVCLLLLLLLLLADEKRAQKKGSGTTSSDSSGAAAAAGDGGGTLRRMAAAEPGFYRASRRRVVRRRNEPAAPVR